MDYCTCGAQAVGRCVAGGEPFCRRECRTYPHTVRDLLAEAGEQPQAEWHGLLCPSCYQDAIEVALPTVARHLLRTEAGSIERVVHRLASRRGWTDSENYNQTLGPDIISAVAGQRPAWLFNSLPRTLAALYATMARSRSLAPRLRVQNEEVSHTPTLFNRHKTTTTVTQLDELRAWPFGYSTDRGFSRRIYVGAEGILLDGDGFGGPIRDGTMTMRGAPGEVRRRLNEMNRKLAEPAHEGYFDGDAVDVLAHAVSRLL
ncbi:hypothetical protein LG634_37260 [Streptomyces bambusae]|uniref:hypothetical protein n=1 Tax=Streptomyces bambusae TaxID=1550616 RepID=UPI001CFF70C9|nr:hypothetical protein [Streptomyces bambusae]MCB5170430.1 hypothetical protein [Streptomyces bambusae]